MPPSDSGEGPPAWLTSLKSRQSQKKPSNEPLQTAKSPAAPAKSPSEAKKPDWLQNLKKKRESGQFDPAAPKATPVVPMPAQKHVEKTEPRKPAVRPEEPKQKEALKPRESVMKHKEAPKPKEPAPVKSPEEEEKPLAPWQKQLKARKVS